MAGGHSAWSNGINLNTIEAASDPAQESLENINAVNDIFKAAFSAEKVTIAAPQVNSGAGRAMAALACAYVWSHRKVVLKPHYKSIGLHGSEYRTHFLPKRVGHKKAHHLTKACMPVSAQSAAAMGMIDRILTQDRSTFMYRVLQQGIILVQDYTVIEKIVSPKCQERTEQWHDMMELVCHFKLTIMRENFSNSENIQEQKQFFNKIKPTSTPLHITLNQYRPPHIFEGEN